MPMFKVICQKCAVPFFQSGILKIEDADKFCSGCEISPVEKVTFSFQAVRTLQVPAGQIEFGFEVDPGGGPCR